MSSVGLLLRGNARAGKTFVLLASTLVVLVCGPVGLGRAAAQGQYAGEEGSAAPPVAERAARPADKVTLCHATGNGGYVAITVDNNATYGGHGNHPNDIIPAPPGGCPTGPPEPTTPEPINPESATATASATATPCPVPEPTTASPSATATAGSSTTAAPEPTTSEPTTEPVSPTASAGQTTPETTGASPSATAGGQGTASPTGTATGEPTAARTATADTASPGFISTPTAIATNPGEGPDGGPFEVTDPEGAVSSLSFYDLDVGDASPLPGGPGGITGSEKLGQRAAAQALAEGGDFNQAVAAAQPFLNACDSRDAVRLAAVQLGKPLPDTGGPASLAIFAAAMLVGSGIFAWRLIRP